MKIDSQAMDDVGKFRLTGAVIWLALLVLIVPAWYSNPVNFSPESERGSTTTSNKLVVYQAYTLPSKAAQESVIKAELSQNKKPVGVAVVKGIEPVAESPVAVHQSVSSEVAKPSAEQSIPAQVVRPKVKVTSIGIPEVKPGQWLLKVYSSKDIKDANRVLAQLDDQYEVWIKEFPKSKTYSVRTGPYTSHALAEADKIKIDKAIRTQSKIEQVK